MLKLSARFSLALLLVLVVAACNPQDDADADPYAGWDYTVEGVVPDAAPEGVTRVQAYNYLEAQALDLTGPVEGNEFSIHLDAPVSDETLVTNPFRCTDDSNLAAVEGFLVTGFLALDENDDRLGEIFWHEPNTSNEGWTETQWIYLAESLPEDATCASTLDGESSITVTVEADSFEGWTPLLQTYSPDANTLTYTTVPTSAPSPAWVYEAFPN